MSEISEHPYRPRKQPGGTGRIERHPQAYVEEWTGKQEYGGKMIQHHAAILSPARAIAC
jgi:hypothetical protein